MKIIHVTPGIFVVALLVIKAAPVDAKVLNYKPENVVKFDQSQNRRVTQTVYGQISNCGDPATQLYLDYEPKNVPTLLKHITLNASFMPTMDWSHGSGTTTVWLSQYPNTPAFQYTKEIKCSYFKYVFPNFAEGVCPFKKGTLVQIKNKTYEYEISVAEYAFPEGVFTGKIVLHDALNRVFACANITVNVSGTEN